MKKFIVRFFIFSVFIFSVFLMIDIYLSKKLKKSHTSPGEIEVWNDIYEGKIDSELLIYGSSRAWVHVDPKTIEDSLNLKAYNFGMDGQNFFLQYLRHKKNLKYNAPPKIIILCVDMFSFNTNDNLYEMNQFLPYMLYDYDIFEFTSEYNGFHKLDYFFPLIRYFSKVNGENSVFKDSEVLNNNFRTKGYKGIERTWNNDFENAKKNNSKFTIKSDLKIIRLFDEFLFECQNNNIQVILVYTPEYIEGQKYVTNRSEILNKFNFFAKKHDLLFLDYSNHELCFNKTFFYNASHLNKKGSEIFSKKLSSDIKQFIFK